MAGQYRTERRFNLQSLTWIQLNFPVVSRQKIEAVKAQLDAEFDLQRANAYVRRLPGRVKGIPSSRPRRDIEDQLWRYILKLLLAVVDEAVRLRLWDAEETERRSREFLSLLMSMFIRKKAMTTKDACCARQLRKAASGCVKCCASWKVFPSGGPACGSGRGWQLLPRRRSQSSRLSQQSLRRLKNPERRNLRRAVP